MDVNKALAARILETDAAPGAIAKPAADPAQLERFLDHIQKERPELYSQYRALFSDSQRSEYNCFNVTQAALVFAYIAPCMFIEYFFSALALPNTSAGLAYAFSTGACTANIALSFFLLNPFVTSLFNGEFRHNISHAFTPWSSRGQNLLIKHYGQYSARHIFETGKPIISFAIKALGTVAALLTAILFYQNTDNAYREAIAQRPELAAIFSPDSTAASVFNWGTIPINFLLFAHAYVAELSHYIDTDFDVLEARGPQEWFYETAGNYLTNIAAALYAFDRSKIANAFLGRPGVETSTPEAKIAYIIKYVRNELDNLKRVVKDKTLGLLAHFDDPQSETSTATRNIEILEGLNAELAKILAPVDSTILFRSLNVLAFAVSTYTSYVYCTGAAGLFIGAYKNADLSWIHPLIELFRAQTERGSKLTAALAIGVFSTIHSTTGVNMPRDYIIAACHSPTQKALAGTILIALAIFVWAGLTGATAEYESHSPIGAFKGASVNAVGVEAMVRAIASLIAVAGLSVLTRTRSCCAVQRTGENALLLAPGGQAGTDQAAIVDTRPLSTSSP